MGCTKVNCPMQAGTLTDNCGENCPWMTTAKMDDLISRTAAIEAVYYNPYSTAVEIIKKVPAVDAVPVVHAKWSKARFEKHMQAIQRQAFTMFVRIVEKK